MERLTTDTPETNTECMLNYAYSKDKNVTLLYADGEEDIDLCEYASRLAKKKGCNYTPEEIMENACMECDCEVAVLYAVAVQAAELRHRLKMYEDTALTPEEVAKAPKWTKFEIEYNEEQEQDELICALPDDEQRIIVTDGKQVWEDTFCFDSDGCFLDDTGRELINDVTHWMPLPEPPPKEDKRCIHDKDNYCVKLSDSTVKQPCIEGPCEFETTDPIHAAGGCYCRECLMWSKAAPKDFMEMHPDYSGGWCSELRQGECSGDNTGCWMSVKKDNPFLQLQGEEDGK